MEYPKECQGRMNVSWRICVNICVSFIDPKISLRTAISILTSSNGHKAMKSISHYRTLWLWFDLLIAPGTFYFHFQYVEMKKGVLNCLIKINTFVYLLLHKSIYIIREHSVNRKIWWEALQWHIHWMPTVPNPPPTFYLYLCFMCNCICICLNLALQRHI